MTNLSRVVTRATTIAAVFADGDNPRASRATSMLAEPPITPDAAWTPGPTAKLSTPIGLTDAPSTEAAQALGGSTGGGAASNTGGAVSESTGSGSTSNSSTEDVSSSSTGSAASTIGTTGGEDSGTSTTQETTENRIALSGRILLDTDTILSINADGSSRRYLGFSGEEGRLAPDGSKVSFFAGFFQDELSHDESGYFVVDADGSNKILLADFSEHGSGGPRDDGIPSMYVRPDAPERPFTAAAVNWSPDGSRVTFAEPAFDCFPPHNADACAPNPNGGIWTAAPDGSDALLLVPGEAMFPIWSSDGSQIAYVSAGSLHMMRADGTVRRLVHEPSDGVVARPSFSPDGTQLAFMVYAAYEAHPWGPGAFDVWVVGANGFGAAQRLAADLTWDAARPRREPQWSPGGTRLAFADDLGVLVADVTSSSTRRLNPSGRADNPSWSPDGGWIATCLDHNSLIAVRPDGSTWVEISPGSCSDPLWIS